MLSFSGFRIMSSDSLLTSLNWRVLRSKMSLAVFSNWSISISFFSFSFSPSSSSRAVSASMSLRAATRSSSRARNSPASSVLRAVSAAVRASSSPMRRDCACSRRRWDRQRTERMPHAAAKMTAVIIRKICISSYFVGELSKVTRFFRKLPYLCANVLKRHGTHYLPFYAFGRLRPPRPRHEDD